MRKKIPVKSLIALSGILSVICFISSVLLMIGFLSGIHASHQPQKQIPVQHRILFLRSYHPLYFTHQAQNAGLERSLYQNGIEYDVYYMDAKSYNSEQDIINFHDFLASRLRRHTDYEAVLIADDVALNFALTYQNELFKGLPMVFFGVNNVFVAEKAAANPLITGFYENQFLSNLINLAISLFPNNKTLVALHDNSEAGIQDFQVFRDFMKRNSDYSIVDLDATKLSQDELIHTLQTLPEDSILFYMTCYSDKYGNIYSMESRTNTVVNNAKVPIFRNYVGGEGKGIIGSYYMDFEDQTFRAGSILNEVLSGKDISTIPLSYSSPGFCIFDWRLMKKNHLDFSLLPENTVFCNRPLESLRGLKFLLYSVLLIIIGLLLIVISSVVTSIRTRSVNRELMLSRDNLVKSENELRYQTEFDEVLDVLNRKTITQKLHEIVKENDVYSIVIIDIDGFKALNENYGHSFADSVLQYIVAILKSMANEDDWMIGRYGGDEFIIFAPGERFTPDHPKILKILDDIRAPIPLGDETLAITASLGIAQSDGISSSETLISNAESAMYEAKNHGRNGASLFDDDMKAKEREEKEIKEKLEAAFTNDGFFMVYQPQVDSQTKEVNGYEALIRMKEPGMYPGKFIPVAERNGWIWKIGRITTELVIRQIVDWRNEGKTLKPVSINYSSNQLNDHGYIAFLEELLKKYDVPANLIKIEITEGLFLEKSALADDIFRRFKEMGIKLLMDDFGTGYSSLGYLTYIPVDVIKLDKSLVDTYLVDGKDSFIKNIIHLMHDLNKEMIIEGVEEEWQFKRLQEFGADTIQGYFFSKPLPANEAIDFKVK